MCKLKPLLSRWLEEADSAQGQLPQAGGDKHSQQVNFYSLFCWKFYFEILSKILILGP